MMKKEISYTNEDGRTLTLKVNPKESAEIRVNDGQSFKMGTAELSQLIEELQYLEDELR